MAARPTDPETLLERALVAIDRGRLKEAVRLLDAARAAAPDDPRVVEAAALAAALSGDRETARAAYEKAVRLDPENPKNLFFLARLYEEEGRAAEAAPLLDEAIRLCRRRLADPPDPEAASDLARIHAHRGEHDRALLAVFRGLAAEPAEPDLLRLLVQSLFNLSHYGQAVLDADAGLAKHPGDATLLLYKGLSLQKLNLMRDAHAALTASLAANPAQPELRKLVARLKRSIARLGPTIEETVRDAPDRPDRIGHVKWFRDETGIGAIADAAGNEYFVHYTAIEKPGYQSLAEGEEVRFGAVDSPQGLLATHIRPALDTRREGVVVSFDPESGVGEVEYDGGRRAHLHFTSILGAGVRLVAPGDRVRFEVAESEHGPQAFNVERLPAAPAGAEAEGDEGPEGASGEGEAHEGVIAEFVAAKGLGVITAGALRAVFSVDDVRRGTPRAGARCRFRTAELEALRGEGVLKAREIDIEP